MTTPPSEWTSIGDVSADHGEILIIANHGVPVLPGDNSPWDRFIGYTAITSKRSPDGATETIVADIYSPGWETPFAAVPGHAREDALIIRTGNPSAYDVEARTCGDPRHTGWCEVRIVLHRHDDEDEGDPEEPDGELPAPRRRPVPYPSAMPQQDGSPAGAPEIRPEIVQALFSALTDMDPAKLAAVAETGITSAERKQAEDLFLASIIVGFDQRERWLQAMDVLIGDRKLSDNPSWSDLFDDLTPERAAQLRDLYDALPDGARAEYDERYGRPREI
jgi:hypothetical protein